MSHLVRPIPEMGALPLARILFLKSHKFDFRPRSAPKGYETGKNLPSWGGDNSDSEGGSVSEEDWERLQKVTKFTRSPRTYIIAQINSNGQNYSSRKPRSPFSCGKISIEIGFSSRSFPHHRNKSWDWPYNLCTGTDWAKPCFGGI